ncbi:SH3 domain-containing protein [Amylocarpus encephaloides]|uniref:SH3 domain-containing protein n=1 Tax=Amylocarpus encephaloides TaxID=45428 RepID=A0A9P8C296_9HELO|nr:SH3 domain-containing protein [Amylocarpus encephaloides]
MPSPPFKVKAVYEYTSPHDDDLHFPLGQIITVTEEEDDEWYNGEYVDASGVKQEGIFPRNFVEKYEPTAPPRPTRTNRPKKEVEPAPEPIPAPVPIQPAHEESELEDELVQEAPVARELPPLAPKVEDAAPPPQPRAVEVAPPPAAPKAVPTSSKPSAPPPVSEKPSGGSFKDRIAAFNKAAPPPAPFKPPSINSESFVKKRWVAPPPSNQAYVPPPREPVQPTKIYRREEDPEIRAIESENQEQAEKAGLAPTSNEGDGEEQTKPTSLKERIALLQKQQADQAARHADVLKKEKPKKPAKKRTESYGNTEGEDGDGASLERKDTEETVGKQSMDSVREEHNTPRRRKSSRGAPTTPSLHPRKSFGDGNEADMSGAGDTTEEPEEMSTGRDDSDEKPRTRAPPPPVRSNTTPRREPDVGEEEGAAEEPSNELAEDEDEEEDEDDIDPEVRRKEELRARMAKMSGGPGMMFGMPMPSPIPAKKKKLTGTNEHKSGEQGAEEPHSATTRAPPVPMMPLPGLPKVRSPEETSKNVEQDDDYTPVSASREPDEVPNVEDVVPDQSRGAPPPVPSQEPTSAPPIPGGRPAPPPIPKESRPAALSMPMSPSPGSESDDEMSSGALKGSLTTPRGEAPRGPPPPIDSQHSPQSATSKRASYFTSEASPISPTSQGSKDRRGSRVPPIPGAASLSSPQSRAPPPQPPNASLGRSSTGDHRTLPSPKNAPKDESEEEVTEYEGDYDTDIASAVPHKDALKAHSKDSNLDESISGRSPVASPTSIPPPLPPTAAPRAVPPPLPSQPPPNSRTSAEVPRAAPPPPPSSKMPAPWEQDDDEYDPYKYTTPKQGPPPSTSTVSAVNVPSNTERNDEDLYSASPPRSHAMPPSMPPSIPQQVRPAPPPPQREVPSQDRPAPPPPPRELGSNMQVLNRGPPRQSLDVHRSAASARRSVELSRISMDSSFVANDIDLGRSSYWWTQPKGIPLVLQNRRDFLHEVEEHTTNQKGKALVTKEVFVLYQDYSQTIVTAEFDAQDPANVNLEQRHEQPPSRLRQDQLEQAHEQFGRRISDAVQAKQNTIVGDGTPQGLVQELLGPLRNVLPPVGSRAYGAVVYGNLANASTQQNDEIRAGDIITLRNTKFQGKHGPMHAKYSMEVGKPDHVGIVAEWDGTKKKVRAWEQGRESKKVKLESFKLDDLRSGEVKIWRVMPRSWVGWQGQN